MTDDQSNSNDPMNARQGAASGPMGHGIMPAGPGGIRPRGASPLLAGVCLGLTMMMMGAFFMVRYMMMPAAGDRAGVAGVTTQSAAGLKVGDVAPGFSLMEVHEAGATERVTLSSLVEKGPVLVVFYLGYSCERCVTHLKEMGDLLPEFERAGITVVAVGPNVPDDMRKALVAYGDIPFSLLYDEEGKTARAYGLLDGDGKPLHGAFIVGRDQQVKFARVGEHPCTAYGEMLAAGKSVAGTK